MTTAIELMVAVRKMRLPLVQKAVLWAITSRLGADGSCWPSYSTLAADVGCSVRAAQLAVRELAKVRGLLVVEEREDATGLHRSNVYRISPQAFAEGGSEIDSLPPSASIEVRPLVEPKGDSEPGSPPVANQVHHGGESGAPRVANHLRGGSESPSPRRDPREEIQKEEIQTDPAAAGPVVRRPPAKPRRKQPSEATATVAVPLEPVGQVFEHWLAARAELGLKGTALLTNPRRRVIEARLRDGYAVADICRAIDGCFATPFNRGENDRQRSYVDIELICRNSGKLEGYRDAAPLAASDDHPVDWTHQDTGPTEPEVQISGEQAAEIMARLRGEHWTDAVAAPPAGRESAFGGPRDQPAHASLEGFQGQHGAGVVPDPRPPVRRAS